MKDQDTKVDLGIPTMDDQIKTNDPNNQVKSHQYQTLDKGSQTIHNRNIRYGKYGNYGTI